MPKKTRRISKTRGGAKFKPRFASFVNRTRNNNSTKIERKITLKLSKVPRENVEKYTARAKKIRERLARAITLRKRIDRAKYELSRPIKLSQNIDRADNFRQIIEQWPIYIISAHGCICPIDGNCGDIVRPSEPKNLFTIPENTILMSFTQGGDMCMSKMGSIEDDIIKHHGQIKKFCILHSSSDVDKIVPNSTPSFFANMKRAAAGSEYPNMVLQFQESDPNRINHLGVFNLQTIYPFFKKKGIRRYTNEEHSIIKKQETVNGLFFLEDVISEVYRRTQIPHGIFIIAACMVHCDPTHNTGMEIAQKAIAVANLEYNSKIPTLTHDELSNTPIERAHNYGMRHVPTMMSAAEVISLIKSGAIDVVKENGSGLDTNKIREIFDKTELDDTEYEKVLSLLL